MTRHTPPPAPAQTVVPGPFGHVDTWIFDLDNTLYSHESQVWPQVNQRITLFLQELFGLDGLSSHALRNYYYHRYGTTLNGLMAEHGIEPDDFLDFAHDVDLSLLEPDPALGAAIAALPGRKLILTNGSVAHARNVAGKLGIIDHFEDVFDIVAAGFTPKPERSTYELFLAKHAVDPGRAAMFEDIEKNLLVPSELGMKTVLIIPRTPDPFREAWEQAAVEAGHVHHVTSDLTAFLTPLARD